MASNRKGNKNSKVHCKKKVVFHNNQFTSKSDTAFKSTSAKKLSENKSYEVNQDQTSLYCIISFLDVFLTLAFMVKCKICDGDINFTRNGIKCLGFKINLECKCGVRIIDSCKMINTGYEINRRIVFVMRLIGVGLNGLQIFCSLMDLCSKFNPTSYYKSLKNAAITVKIVAENVLKKSGLEEKEKTKEQGLTENDLSVSGDGTWSKRGFSSLLGVTSIIGKYTGKILDVFISSKTCKTCEIMKKNSLLKIFLFGLRANTKKNVP